MQLRPADFARYIAVSACCMRSSADKRRFGTAYATPILAVTNMSPAFPFMGSRSASRMRSASTTDCVGLSVVLSRTTNSSPAMRATVACGEMALVNRRATSVSMASPVEWPRLSLMLLNRSTSIKRTVGRCDVFQEE